MAEERGDALEGDALEEGDAVTQSAEKYAALRPLATRVKPPPFDSQSVTHDLGASGGDNRGIEDVLRQPLLLDGARIAHGLRLPRRRSLKYPLADIALPVTSPAPAYAS